MTRSDMAAAGARGAFLATRSVRHQGPMRSSLAGWEWEAHLDMQFLATKSKRNAVSAVTSAFAVGPGLTLRTYVHYYEYFKRLKHFGYIPRFGKLRAVTSAGFRG
jgi:hypothetical protein